MKPLVEALRALCPDVEQAFIAEHLARLGDRYFESFSRERIAVHIAGLHRLSASRPVEVILEERGPDHVDCTVLGFDYPRVFSFLTGILAGTGFNILFGEVFTYSRGEAHGMRAAGDTELPEGEQAEPRVRRRIVDHFSGVAPAARQFESWAAEFKERVEEVFHLLEQGDDESLNRAASRVNDLVIKRLAAHKLGTDRVLYPVSIEMDNESGPNTRMKVVGQDTFAFLYMLTNALSLHNLSIERVRIRTPQGRVEDEIEFVDSRGRKIEDPETIRQIKLSVLLTKQFSYFLEKAPDPYAAVRRFRFLVEDVLRLPKEGRWMDLLSNPETLRDLARVLGTSDVLWEEFVRLQYETLLPMLDSQVNGHRFSTPPESLAEKLRRSLEGAEDFQDLHNRLNRFKDREIFLIDLDHILGGIDFRTLSKRLTRLAELVVNAAVQAVYGYLVERYGVPRSVGDLEGRFAVLGLGKLGGAALGYASDIEILFVYSDNGATDGDRSISNSEFFDRLVREVIRFIESKRQGIFRIDLRLRPYGSGGPLACSLETFCRYYGKDGQAHSYERLALVRLRAIGGDAELGSRIERLRDGMVYASRSIDPAEILDLRKRQFAEKVKDQRLNAKFSPGGLVDLEYDVQILQVIHGRNLPRLRTPRIHEALSALEEGGILSPSEAERLTAAYDFLRNLINGLRMLRGSAEDLFLPDKDSLEFGHLARRMGYQRGHGLDAAQRLYLDFETHTAAVRAFVEQHFGRDSLPGGDTGTVADLVLSEDISETARRKILAEAGFRDPERAYVNLRFLAGTGSSRTVFARLAVLAADILAGTPDPDMALNNLERFMRMTAAADYQYNMLLAQPMRLEMMLTLFAGSQFLSDTLIRHPGFLDWLILPENLHGAKERPDLEDELGAFLEGGPGETVWLNELRRFRRREILRIGARDMYLNVPCRRITHELSCLAEALTGKALEKVWRTLREEGKEYAQAPEPENRLCVFAMGKLGGDELNYSSDIDLVAAFDDGLPAGSSAAKAQSPDKVLFTRAVERLRADLSVHTEAGYVYRVDLRLRPYGTAGDLVPSLSALIRYYEEKASLWEIQALLKMRPVAGNLELGRAFLHRMRPVILKPRIGDHIVQNIERMREQGVRRIVRSAAPSTDVKDGLGGLRDVEFLVQGLQLLHGGEHPEVVTGNTLAALDAFRASALLPGPVAEQLSQDYTFLRKVEHALQLLEDRQIHAIPSKPAELSALAKRVLGVSADADTFVSRLDECLERVRRAFKEWAANPVG